MGGESKQTTESPSDVRQLDVSFRIANQDKQFKEHLFDLSQFASKSLSEMLGTSLDEYLIIFAKYIQHKRDGR
jgi:hypothetical protein